MLLLSTSVSLVYIPHVFMNFEPVYKVSIRNLYKVEGCIGLIFDFDTKYQNGFGKPRKIEVDLLQQFSGK